MSTSARRTVVLLAILVALASSVARAAEVKADIDWAKFLSRHTMKRDQPENRELIAKSFDRRLSMPQAFRGYSWTGAASISAAIANVSGRPQMSPHVPDFTPAQNEPKRPGRAAHARPTRRGTLLIAEALELNRRHWRASGACPRSARGSSASTARSPNPRRDSPHLRKLHPTEREFLATTCTRPR